MNYKLLNLFVIFSITFNLNLLSLSNENISLSIHKVFYDMPYINIKVSSIPKNTKYILVFKNDKFSEKFLIDKKPVFPIYLSEQVNNIKFNFYDELDNLISESLPLTVDTSKFIPNIINLENNQVITDKIILKNIDKINKITIYTEEQVIPYIPKTSYIPSSILPQGVIELKISLQNIWGESDFYKYKVCNIKQKFNENTFIFVDKSSLLLTYIKDKKIYKTYPIAIGTPKTPTKAGVYIIGGIEKMYPPTTGWGVIRLKWFNLNDKNFSHWSGYAIHGTNNPSSIGKEASHGCVRMFNNDVLELSKLVNIGTKILIKD